VQRSAPAILEQEGAALYCGLNKELSMLALYIILGFVAGLAAINFIEFGRVD
jgi:ribose/xylose/arabinose/galactoside ABC-type transport system permease subunit